MKSVVSTSMDSRNWADLDNDCQINIFVKVGDTTTLMESSVQFVCKSWFRAALNLCGRGTLSFAGCSCSSIHVKFAVECSQGLATSVTFQSNNCSSMGLHYLADGCPLLKVLDVGYMCVRDGNLGPVLISCIPKWKNLEKLKIAECYFIETLVETIGVNCKHFVQLNCTDSEFHNADIEAIVKFLPRLKSLDMSYATMRRCHLVALLTSCKDLEYFDASYSTGFQVDYKICDLASHIEDFDFGWHDEYEFSDYVASQWLLDIRWSMHAYYHIYTLLLEDEWRPVSSVKRIYQPAVNNMKLFLAFFSL